VVRHPDFEKIHVTFLQHYSKDPAMGESRYAEWVKVSELDETKGYYAQAAERAGRSSQSFEWAKFLLQFVKEDKDAKYYKVEALFPVESMNKDSPPFTRDEVLQSARSLTGKPSNQNHDSAQLLEGVEIVAAQFEDDCVECLVRVPKSSQLIGLIDRKEIVSVSIEGEWSHGLPGFGLVLTGLAWLTKQSKLPGIPLTRIVPVERIVESFEVKALVLEHLKSASSHGKVKFEVQEQDGRPACAVCGEPADFLVSICQECLDKAGAQVQSDLGVEKMEKEELKRLVEEGVKEGLKKAGVSEAQWNTEYVNNLPDDCFAAIEPGGTIDDQGKTTPRSLRHLEFKNVEGNLDADHVRNALARLDQTNISAELKKSAVKKLCAAAAELNIESAVCNLDKSAQSLHTKLTEAEDKLAVAEGKLGEANKAIEQLKQLVPGVDILANPPKLMPVREALNLVNSVTPSRMVQRSWGLGPQRMCQELARVTQTLERRLK